MLGLAVNYHAMAHAAATIVTNPDNLAVLAKEGLQAFHYQVADGSLICFWWQGAVAIARQVGNID